MKERKKSKERRCLRYCKMLVSASWLIASLILITQLVPAQLILPQAEEEIYHYPAQDDRHQIPIQVGFGWQEPKMGGTQPNGPPLLSDILGIDRSLSIFAGLGRSIESIVTFRLLVVSADNGRPVVSPMNLSTRLFSLPETLCSRHSHESHGKINQMVNKYLNIDQRIYYGIRKKRTRLGKMLRISLLVILSQFIPFKRAKVCPP